MLEHYQAERCPSTQTVRAKQTHFGASHVTHNPLTAEREGRNDRVADELMPVGDEDKIPFLIDTDRGEPIHEGAAIVDALGRHYSLATETQ